jgi:hypothetical protein
MIVIVIVSAIMLGWAIGNFFLDRWVDENNKEINKDNDGI